MKTLNDPCRGNHDGDNDGAPDPYDDARAALIDRMLFVAKSSASTSAKEKAVDCIDLLRARLLP